MSVLQPQRPVEPSVVWLARYRTGVLQWFGQHLSGDQTPSPRFDIWAGLPGAGPLYNEASGLGWDAAVALAARCRSERPGARVLVLDATGSTVG